MSVSGLSVTGRSTAGLWLCSLLDADGGGGERHRARFKGGGEHAASASRERSLLVELAVAAQAADEGRNET